MKRLVAISALMAGLAACSQASPKVADHPPREAGGPAGPFNWDAPQLIGSFLAVTDISSMSSYLKFTPVQPRLNGLLQIYVTDPNKISNLDGMLIEYYYQDSTYGRIVVEEQLATIQVSDLEGRLVYNADANSPVVFALVTLSDGTEAVLETRKVPSDDGLAPNSIEFLLGGADITVFGPDGTFTADKAVLVADLVLP